MTTARRELTATVLASAAAGGLALFAAGQTWATFSAVRPEPLPPVAGVLAGSAHAPLVPAAGLVLLAAAVALLAVRGSGRAAVGLLMAVAGGALLWSGLRALSGGLAESAGEVLAVAGTPVVAVSAVWPGATVLAGVLGAGAGAFTVLRGRRWPAMGGRYERTPSRDGGRAAAPRPRTAEEQAQLAWQALDRGEDPTDPADGPRP
jgi:uncharacterized membrane protein (TIGR02234 family)